MIDFGHGAALVNLKHEDSHKLRAWRNNMSIWKWCRQNDLIEYHEHHDWFEKQRTDPSIKMYQIQVGTIGIGSGEPLNVAGVCGLTSIDTLNRRAEFSCYVGPEYQKKGYAKAALKTLFDHGFKNLGLKLIYCETFEGNPAIHLFENTLKMKREGVRRSFYFKDGKFIDAVLLSVLDTEWL